MTKLDQAPSPFILLHKDNPVQWRLWSSETLAEAKAQNKPLFVSLGFMGCHWCHTMNSECFTDKAIAETLNRDFIPVIVDREERPDLDLVFQSAAQAMGHQGGWPLSMFLTPEGLPFYVGGFQPKEERLGLKSFPAALAETTDLFTNQHDRVNEAAAAVAARMEQLFNRDMRAQQGSINLDFAALRIAQRYDIFFGGLQGGLKFPNPLVLDVLWRAYLRSGTPQFSQLVFTTLDAILFGGVYDHIGGGFFRYSVDERWIVPSFEKTISDSAMMIDVATGVWQFNRNALCSQRVEETIGWLTREMKIGECFAAALNPDSDGEEGKFYVWSEAEIDAALVGTFSARFKQVYGVTRDGVFQGKNVLRRLGNPPPASEADDALLAKQRGMLLAVRDKRVRPQRDDTIMTDWNGLVIAAVARAGVVFQRPEWITQAIVSFDAIVKMMGEGEILFHSSYQGRKGAPGFAEDYANMARAALQLLEITGEDRFLDAAKTWTSTLNTHFWNNALGGYCVTSDDAEAPPFVRPRSLVDQPTPPANGTMLTVLTRLALLTGDTDHMTRASTIMGNMGDEMNRVATQAGGFIAGFEVVASALEVLVVGTKGHARTQELVRAFWSRVMPNALLVQIEPTEELPAGHPATGQGMVGGQPTAYVIQQGRCSNPITSAQQLAQGLTLPVQSQQQQPQQQRSA